MNAPVTLDFETHPIEPRPDYPPKPVGLAIYEPGKKIEYLAFGHPSGNSTTFEHARDRYRDILRSDRPIVLHNAKFDLDVGETHFGVKLPPWHRIHDTMPLAFLVDPYASSYALKTLAEEALGLLPDERDELRDWIVANVPEARAKKRQWGRYICKAPGYLVAKYAIGDVTRTRKLFDLLHPIVQEADMGPAYDRERKLIPIFLKNERRGVYVDLPKLRRDVPKVERSLAEVDRWIGRRLGVKDLDIDAREDLAQALDDAGLVDEWPLTPKSGKRKTSKDVFENVIHDGILVHTLAYRAKLANSLRSFMRPWWEVASSDGGDGRIFTSWNSVRQSDWGENRNLGAKTGRISSTPNLQNIARVPNIVTSNLRDYNALKDEEAGALLIQRSLHQKVSQLPNLRRYILPDPGGVLLDRDYDQQELRILAHYEDDQLLRAYKLNPSLDQHRYAQQLVNDRLAASYPRKYIKTIAFGILYGMGIKKLAKRLGTEEETAWLLRSTYREILPGVSELEDELRNRAARDEPIYTLGGRRYYCEAPKVIDGELRTFAYRLINTLIQGSAADMLKEATIRYDEVATDSRTLIWAHDEFAASAAKGACDVEMRKLREAMESVELDAPLLSSGKIGPNWAELKTYDDKRGVRDGRNSTEGHQASA